MLETVYGSWLNVMGEISLRAGLDTYAGEHLSTEQIDLLEQGYRAAIAKALEGTGVVLVGDEFIGPADRTWDDVTTSVLAELIKTIDFNSLVIDYIPGDDEHRPYRETVWCEAHGGLSNPHFEADDCIHPHLTDQATRERMNRQA